MILTRTGFPGAGELVKKDCFEEGVLWIRPSPCPLPARGEGVLSVWGLRPHTP